MGTTQIQTGKTVGQILDLLSRYHAASIRSDYQNGEIVAISFLIKVHGRDIPFMLPCRWEAIHDKMHSNRKRAPYKVDLKGEAKKIAWRQIYRWTEAQLALVDTGMVKIEEVFLPYTLDRSGKTLYQIIEQRGFALEWKKGEKGE